VGPPHDDYTLRELTTMAEAKAETEWDHTASLMALIAEANRDPEQRRRPFKPAESHPLHQRPKRRQELTDEEAEAALYALAGKRRPAKPKLWDTIKEKHGRPA
jgi:hypothetical protein